MLQVKDLINRDNLNTDHVTVRSELTYLTGAKAVGTVNLEPRFGSNPAENPRFCVRSGKQPAKTKVVPVFWPGLEPNQAEQPVNTRTTGGSPGPVANNRLMVSIQRFAELEAPGGPRQVASGGQHMVDEIMMSVDIIV